MERTKLKLAVTKEGVMTIDKKHEVYERRKTCRACHSEAFEPVLSLGSQYLVRFVPAIDLSLPKSPLDLVRCTQCGLLQLQHTVDPDLLFREFWYRSGINESMRMALKDIVDAVALYKLEGTWLDIGANDGYLLSQLPDTFTRIACEPARNFHDELHKIADHVIADYFTADNDCLWRSNRTGGCDVITTAAMFYDLDNPDRFVTDIANVLAPGGVWVNQLNDSPTMVQANAFDSICHEHLCYYDIWSLRDLYARHGLAIVDVTYNDVNGGSMRVFAQKAGPGVHPMSMSGFKRVSSEDARGFAARVRKWKQVMTETLEGPGKPWWLYGASTKGCVLLQYLDYEGGFVGIADRNPTKLGLIMSGSWLPIASEEEMRADKPSRLMVLPWAFKNEFIKRERTLLDQGTVMVFPLPNLEFVL